MHLEGISLGPGNIQAKGTDPNLRGLLISPLLPDIEEGQSRVLAILTGETSYDNQLPLPPNTYRIEIIGHEQPEGRPHKVTTPEASVWAGANEAPPGASPNAIFTRLEIDCRGILHETPNTPRPSTVAPRQTRRMARRRYDDDHHTPFHVMALVQTGPVGPAGEIYVDYKEAFKGSRDYPRVVDTRPIPDIPPLALSTLASQYGVSIEAIAIAHGVPDASNEGSLHLCEESRRPHLSTPIAGLLALSRHKRNKTIFIEELFITGSERGKGRGPLLIYATLALFPHVTEIHLITNRDPS